MTMFKDVNRVIFDLDNTIFKHDAESEFKIICEKLKLPYNEIVVAQLCDFFNKNERYIKGKRVTKSYMGYVAEELIPMLKIKRIRGVEFIEVLNGIDTTSLMEGSIEVLEYLSEKGYMIIALSNWFLDHQYMVMKKLNISDYFERVYTWDDFYAKPDKRSLQRIINNNDEKEYVLIGDNLTNDILFAKSNGIKSIWFNSFKSDEMLEFNGAVEINSLNQIMGIL